MLRYLLLCLPLLGMAQTPPPAWALPILDSLHKADLVIIGGSPTNPATFQKRLELTRYLLGQQQSLSGLVVDAGYVGMYHAWLKMRQGATAREAISPFLHWPNAAADSFYTLVDTHFHSQLFIGGSLIPDSMELEICWAAAQRAAKINKNTIFANQLNPETKQQLIKSSQYLYKIYKNNYFLDTNLIYINENIKSFCDSFKVVSKDKNDQYKSYFPIETNAINDLKVLFNAASKLSLTWHNMHLVIRSLKAFSASSVMYENSKKSEYLNGLTNMKSLEYNRYFNKSILWIDESIYNSLKIWHLPTSGDSSLVNLTQMGTQSQAIEYAIWILFEPLGLPTEIGTLLPDGSRVIFISSKYQN